MRWPWQARAADRAALRAVEEKLAEVREQWTEVHEMAAESRIHKRRNHFGETIARIYKESP